MKPYFEADAGVIYQGHVLEVLSGMKAESCHIVVTSPPYWGLRDYNLPPQIWGGDSGCEHVWGDELKQPKINEPKERPELRGCLSWSTRDVTAKPGSGQFCQSCNAWRGSFGLEPTPELYIEHTVEIFREVWRVLRKDGTVWLNLGDSYNTNQGGNWGKHHREGRRYTKEATAPYQGYKTNTLKPKDLCGIPWRVALALQADGWWLRSAMPWVKHSAMPESCSDRPASALEHMFLLTKNQKYYFDMEAIKQEPQRLTEVNWKDSDIDKYGEKMDGRFERQGSYRDWNKYKKTSIVTSRNFRNTDLFYQSIEPPHGMLFCGDEMVGLDVNPKAMKEAHFATFPPKLVEPCVLAGTSEKGCCAECGSPWVRVVEKSKYPKEIAKPTSLPNDGYVGGFISDGKKRQSGSAVQKWLDANPSKTIGWEPTCECFGPPLGVAEFHIGKKPIPCTILDPFGGSMTTAIVAHKHGRKFVMIELSKTYIDDIGIPRIEKETRQLKLWK